jgi:hypothetical protein
MEVRDAVEADAEALATLTDSPEDVMRNLVHDRTVRVAEDDDIVGFVSFDARDNTVHVTQLAGDRGVCDLLLEEPIRFAESEGMTVELLVPEDDDTARGAAERKDFEHVGTGPRFEGQTTLRYRYG